MKAKMTTILSACLCRFWTAIVVVVVLALSNKYWCVKGYLNK